MKLPLEFRLSFDTVALFPSIGMAEAFDLLEQRIQQDPTLNQRTNLTPNELGPFLQTLEILV